MNGEVFENLTGFKQFIEKLNVHYDGSGKKKLNYSMYVESSGVNCVLNKFFAIEITMVEFYSNFCNTHFQ